jgi:uncharacterized membrane protein SpoIIM required for sporulation
MVLESIISPLSAAEKPWKLFFIGILYSTIGLTLGWWVFRQHTSLVMVFLTVMAAVPLFYYSMIKEEALDLTDAGEMSLLKKHSKVLLFFIVLFLGMTLSYALWYVFLPSASTNIIFSVQTQTISAINQHITGDAIISLNIFSKIFFNNIKVLIFCILFSFLYGAGAIFILTWNASVLGTAIGNFIKSHISTYALGSGATGIGIYFSAFSLSLLRYFIHGIPEIFAYFVAGLAGGILSVALAKHHLQTNNFQKIMLDVSNLVLIAVGILIIAAVLEVFVTPLLF